MPLPHYMNLHECMTEHDEIDGISVATSFHLPPVSLCLFSLVESSEIAAFTNSRRMMQKKAGRKKLFDLLEWHGRQFICDWMNEPQRCHFNDAAVHIIMHKKAHKPVCLMHECIVHAACVRQADLEWESWKNGGTCKTRVINQKSNIMTLGGCDFQSIRHWTNSKSCRMSGANVFNFYVAQHRAQRVGRHAIRYGSRQCWCRMRCNRFDGSQPESTISD